MQVKHLAKKVYRRLAYKKLQEPRLSTPDTEEARLIDELRQTFSAISEQNKDVIADWDDFQKQVFDCVMNEDPRRFLNWAVIRKTMFISGVGYAIQELKYLKSLPHFNPRWKTAIIESEFGAPPRYKHLDNSSGNLVHHAYHLARFEEKTGQNCSKFDQVVEFGGGYGGMARLFQKLHFNGVYIIFDLPYFSAIQRYYLKSLGFPLITIDELTSDSRGIILLSEIEDLKKTFDTLELDSNALFLATWSLSETPLAVRQMIEPFFGRFSSFLLAYQNSLGEIDNQSYFQEMQSSLANIQWTGWEIPHLPDNSYLMGTAVTPS